VENTTKAIQRITMVKDFSGNCPSSEGLWAVRPSAVKLFTEPQERN